MGRAQRSPSLRATRIPSKLRPHLYTTPTSLQLQPKNDRLATQPPPWRDLLLHGQPLRSSKPLAHPTHRHPPRRRRPNPNPHPTPHRCLGGPPGSHALPLDSTGRRYQFLGPLEGHKNQFLPQTPPGEYRSASRTAKRERGIWQRRFWEHNIRDDRDYAIHMDYVHFNPVKHGLVGAAANWPFASFHWAGRTDLSAGMGKPRDQHRKMQARLKNAHGSNKR